MTPGGWQRRARRGAVAALRLGVMVGALAFLARGVAWADVAKTLRGASVSLLAVVIALNGLMTAVKAARLRLLLGGRPSLWACFLARLTSSAINNVTPFRGGDVARVWMLERHAGITKSVAALVAGVEHLFDLGALSVLAAVAARLIPHQRWALVATPVIFAAAFALLALARWAAASLGTTGAAGATTGAEVPPSSTGRGLAARVRGLLAHFAPGARPLLEPRTRLACHALSFAGWGLEAIMIVLTARAISVPVGVPLAIVVLLGINAAIALPSMPASAGAFEAGVTLVLLAAGVAKGPAVALALLYHLVQVVPVTLAGAAVVFRVGFTLRGLGAPQLGGGSVRAAEAER